MAEGNGNGNGSKLAHIANHTTTVILARMSAIFGPIIAVALLSWVLGTMLAIKDSISLANQLMAVHSEQIANLRESDKGHQKRIDRLEDWRNAFIR